MGLHFRKAQEKTAVDNENRPVKVIKVAEGIYHIVYAD